MSSTFKNIKMEDIENVPGKKLQVEFEDFLDGIISDEPIKSSLEVVSLGDFIEVKGNITGVAILSCDLCLENYEYDLDIEVEELFAKNALMDEYGQETELKESQFVTDLKGSSDIDICDLLYQSVILDFPNKKVCGINCKGGDIFIRDEHPPEEEIDPRMAVFKDIQLKKADKNNKKSK